MKKTLFLEDLKSSFVVFLVALPLCLGISLASGAPLSAGIIAGIVGGVVVGFLSESNISVSGPAAGLTVIVFSGVVDLGGFQNLGIVLIMAGVMQVLFSFLRGGTLGEFFPVAVIKGMLAAIGLILIKQQLPHILGTTSLSYPIKNLDPNIMLISSISLTIMIFWEKLANHGLRFFRLIPGALVAVVFCVSVNSVFKIIGTSSLVKLPSHIFKQLGIPSLDHMSWNLILLALTIAVVASLESLLSIDAADKIDPNKRKTNKNRELFAQGIGNAVSGFLGGLPVTAVIVRTTANVSAGAKSKNSAIFHGVWLLLCVLFIPRFLNLIPLATLACVLCLVGYKLTKPVLYIEMWKRGFVQFLIFMVTIASILTTDLLKGIFIGLGVALIFEFRNFQFNPILLHRDTDKLHINFVKNVSFLHRPQLEKHLRGIEGINEIHFHGLQLVRVHVDVHEHILNYHEEAHQRNLSVFLVDKENK